MRLLGSGFGAFEVRDGHRALGEDGDGGVRADAPQLLTDARRNVGDRLDVDAADGVRFDLAVQADAGFLQDQGEKLHLPLVVGRELRSFVLNTASCPMPHERLTVPSEAASASSPISL